MEPKPEFDDAFRSKLRDLIVWRRDVRRFRADALPDSLLQDLVALSCLAPSVGLSEPWRFVHVTQPDRRAAIRMEFERANAEALAGYSGEQAALYATLKLAGLDSAPVHLSVWADQTTRQGQGLGRRTMPEMLEYSVVGAVMTFWLAARAHGIGVGWVSILEPARVNAILDLPASWLLVAYLCVGYPQDETVTPELQRAGWEKRATSKHPLLLTR